LYFGYTDSNGKEHIGYLEQIQKLLSQFPLSESQIIGEKRKKDFILLFGAILRLRNVLTSFDEFDENAALSLGQFQDYLSRYNDLKDEWNEEKKRGASVDIDDDIVFEIELLRQIDVNIDYILALVEEYHASHEKDKELLITIQKTIDSSSELRSKKELIEAFLKKLGEVNDVQAQWKEFVFEEQEKDLKALIAEEKLKPEETRHFIDAAFQSGEIKTIGTDLNKIMPPISRFSRGKAGGREAKKHHIINRLQTFFNKYFGAV
ncbi:MAG: hypothetical protein K2H85_06625, partial [Allobaculum sp.]|nr:hypothetical protein [Allobaculum sp.]